jgi:hypothetical protein
MVDGVTPGSDDASSTSVAVLVGAAITVVTTTAVPLSPVLGGGVAGYLDAGPRRSGLRVGALVGAVAASVLLLVGILLLRPMYRAIGGTSPVPGLGVVAVAGIAYVLAFSTVGGYLGSYVAAETRG